MDIFQNVDEILYLIIEQIKEYPKESKNIALI